MEHVCNESGVSPATVQMGSLEYSVRSEVGLTVAQRREGGREDRGKEVKGGGEREKGEMGGRDRNYYLLSLTEPPFSLLLLNSSPRVDGTSISVEFLPSKPLSSARCSLFPSGRQVGCK